jgi:hypothetical protein
MKPEAKASGYLEATAKARTKAKAKAIARASETAGEKIAARIQATAIAGATARAQATALHKQWQLHHQRRCRSKAMSEQGQSESDRSSL